MSNNNLHLHLSDHVKSFESMGMKNDPYEYDLIKDWRTKTDERALKRLLDHHEKLVKRISYEYRGYGLPLEELVAEGHIGLLHAVKNFDMDKGFRFATYATWWVKSMINEYVFKASALLSYSSSKKNKRMFFNLRSLAHKYGYLKDLTPSQADHLAKELDVNREDILSMYSQLGNKGVSVNAKINHDDDDGSEWQDWIADNRPDQETYLAERQEYLRKSQILKEALGSLNERERKIFFDRRLKEPPRTLEELAMIFDLTKERIRQIEVKALTRLQTTAKNLCVQNNFIH